MNQAIPPSIFPIKADHQSNDTTWIFRAHFEAEFPQCPEAFWALPSIHSRPSDFYAFEVQNDEIVLSTYFHEYHLPLAAPGDSLYLFHAESAMKIRLDSLDTLDVLGVLDSVRFYSVWDSGANNAIGFIHLSKQLGLVQYTPFAWFDQYPNQVGTSTRTLNSIQDHPQQGSIGYTPVAKSDFMPYEIGDRLLFNHHYYLNEPSFPEVNEYHALTIGSVGIEPEAFIAGTCLIYDEQGFLKEVDSTYRIDLDPFLEEVATYPQRVPFLSHHEFSIPATHHYGVDEAGDFYCSINSVDRSICDTHLLVDGAINSMYMNATFGLLDIVYGGIRPEKRWSLYAAEMNSGNFGVWPTWLNIVNVGELSGVTVFPNPAEDYIEIKGWGPSRQCQILDFSGNVIQYSQASEGRRIDLSSRAPGIYFIQDVESGKVKRFVKR